MSPSNESKNLDIEALRGYAIAITIVAHLGTLVPEWRSWTGYFWLGGGVDLFFALSGFLITRSLLASLRSGGSFRRLAAAFWVRRAFRLWPAALLWSSTTLGLSALLGDSETLGRTFEIFRVWLAGAFNVANAYVYACAVGYPQGCQENAIWHYWSLSLEEQFYLLAPSVLFLFGRSRVLVVACLLVAFAQAFAARPWASILWFFRSDALLFGCAVALALHHGIDGFPRRAMEARRGATQALLALFLVMLIVSARSQIAASYMGLVSMSAGIIVFVVASDRSYLTSAPWAKSAAAYLGSRSYSTYLVHLPVLATVREGLLATAPDMLATDATRLVSLALALVSTFALAELSFRVVETPLRLLGRRLAPHGKGTTREAKLQSEHAEV